MIVLKQVDRAICDGCVFYDITCKCPNEENKDCDQGTPEEGIRHYIYIEEPENEDGI